MGCIAPDGGLSRRRRGGGCDWTMEIAISRSVARPRACRTAWSLPNRGYGERTFCYRPQADVAGSASAVHYRRMEQPYFGPTQKAVEHLNGALALPATGAEQDWELELADPSKLSLMLQLLNSAQLDGEIRSALAALTLHTMQQAYEDGIDVSSAVQLLKRYMQTNTSLRLQMIGFWSRFDPVLAALA